MFRIFLSLKIVYYVKISYNSFGCKIATIRVFFGVKLQLFFFPLRKNYFYQHFLSNVLINYDCTFITTAYMDDYNV